MKAEYILFACAVCVHATQFISFQVVGLTMGLVVGMGCSILVFVVTYASELK